MKWFKIETDILTHPKINSLTPSDLKMWLFMLALAAKNDGRLPDAEGIAKALSRRLDHVLKALLSLSKSGLIESYEDGFTPHNWEKYQAGSYSSAKRMRKWRAKCDVTVTPENRIEKNRKKERSPKGDPKKGFRLPESWVPDEGAIEWAKGSLSLAPDDVRREAEAFKDHWKAAAGSTAVKLDWDAAFRNWLRRAKPGGGNGGGFKSAKERHKDQVWAEIEARWARSEAEHDDEQESTGSQGKDRLCRADEAGRVRPADAGIPGYSGGGANRLWTGRVERGCQPHHSHAYLFDIPDGWRDH
jgi:hypothetical protein